MRRKRFCSRSREISWSIWEANQKSYGEEKADSALCIHRFAVLFYEEIDQNAATCGGEAEENAADEIGEIVRASAMDVHVFDARQQVIAEDEVDAGGYP